MHSQRYDISHVSHSCVNLRFNCFRIVRRCMGGFEISEMKKQDTSSAADTLFTTDVPKPRIRMA